MKIVKLDRTEYQPFIIDDSFKTKALRLVRIHKNKHIDIEIRRKKLFRKKEYPIRFQFFSSHIHNSEVFAIFERKKMIACIEGSFFQYDHTFRIWNLFVSKRHRRETIGTMLINHIEEVAQKHEARAIMLNLASTNDPAIRFFEKLSYHFIGLNTLAYTNSDIENKCVNLTYGKRLEINQKKENSDDW